MHTALLAPVVALVLWSFVMCAWMYATRIPAIVRARVKLDPRESARDLQARMPPEVRWKGENYNNLMEQPTLFYALAISLAMLSADGVVNVALAWVYVALRIAHSLVHVTINIVVLRFAVFILGTLVLAILAVRAGITVLWT